MAQEMRAPPSFGESNYQPHWQQAPPQNPASMPHYPPASSRNTNTYTTSSYGPSMSQPLSTGNAWESSLPAAMPQQSTGMSAYPQTEPHSYPDGQSNLADSLVESPLQEQPPGSPMMRVPYQTAQGPVSPVVNSVQPPVAPVPIQPAPSIPEPPAMASGAGGGTGVNHAAEGKPKKKTKWPRVKRLLLFMKKERGETL
ncbi:hypothetical protein P691DRAFT_806601 [Macrolepiota fuliginosa MF-IS2]|uniref:Uncharacterized protein n=1 Tax=Macrolepiota fuliginosa MF-IS2 TaxID=1400762 RepID=A0A9P6C0Z2_9AGAR|nr:hypothetical protein P691DRAFT_806601 [Macrolepiota fuliginosa MF-IS2]